MWKFSDSVVWIPLGAIALTRMFVFTYSMASARVSCTTAPFVMQYTTVYAWPIKPAFDATLTMFPAVCEQMRDRGLRGEEIAVDVHAHHAAVLIFGHVGDVIRARDPGVVAEHVEVAERIDARRDQGSALGGLGDVTHARLHRPARVGDERGGLGEPFHVEVVTEDTGAFRGQAE